MAPILSVFLLGLVSSFVGPAAAKRSLQKSDRPRKLHPCHNFDYMNAVGIERRDFDEKSLLSKRKNAKLMYATGSEDGLQQLAQLQLDLPEGSSFIVIEELDGLLGSVKCNNAGIDLLFNAAPIAELAFKEWHLEDGHNLYFITNHDGCGDNEDRHIYHATAIEPVDDGRTIRVAAVERELEHVSQNFELELMRRDLSGKRLRIRQSDGFERIVNDVGDGIGELLPDGTEEFDQLDTYEVGEPGKRTNLYPGIIPNAPGGIAVDCVDCFARAELGITGKIVVENLVPTEFDLSMQFSEIVTSAVFNVELSSEFEPTPKKPLEVTIATYNPIGLLSRYIEIGPTISLKLGLEPTTKGNLNFTAGITSTIKDSSFSFNSKFSEENATLTSPVNVQGWKPTLQTSYEINSIDGEFGFNTFLEPSITFGIDVLTSVKAAKPVSFKLEQGLRFRTPQLATSFKLGYNRSGFCDGQDGDTGVKIANEASATAEVDLRTHRDVIFEKTLFEKPIAELPEVCFATKLPDEVREKLKKEAEELERKQEEERKAKGAGGAAGSSLVDLDGSTSGASSFGRVGLIVQLALVGAAFVWF